MKDILSALILILGITAYTSAVVQMLLNHYSPSFFSRGIWFLLGINSFAGVLKGGGSHYAILLAGTLFVGNTAVFLVSYKKGSRAFHSVEKVSLVLFVVSTLAWLAFDSPFVGLIIALAAQFIGGIPTIVRVAKRPHSEQAYHWYFFCPASILTVIASDTTNIRAILFPVYFACFDGMIICLANRKRLARLFSRA